MRPKIVALLSYLGSNYELLLYCSLSVNLIPSSYFIFHASFITIPVIQIIKRVGLTNYASLPCGTYSGGNKRKLAAAITLIGEPRWESRSSWNWEIGAPVALFSNCILILNCRFNSKLNFHPLATALLPSCTFLQSAKLFKNIPLISKIISQVQIGLSITCS